MAQHRSVRSLYLVISFVQLITIFERQVFDFMGYMWLSIGLNFLHVINVILGIFGVLQYRCGYIILAVVWNLLWVAWNAFVVCLHLDVGELRKEMHILNVGTRTSNWWLANGPGCSPTYNFSAIDPISFKPQIVRVEKCLLDYQYVEVAHSSMQMLLSISILLCGTFLAVFYRGKDATCFEDQKSNPLPGYSLTLKPSSTDHSTPDELYGIPTKSAPLSNFRNSTYETTSRSTNHPYNGTIPSAHSNANNGPNPLQAGSTRRTSVRPSSIYNNSSNAPNDPIYRVTRNGQNMNGILNGVDNVRAYKHLQAPVTDGAVGSEVSSILNAGMRTAVTISQSVKATYEQNSKRQPNPTINIPQAPIYMPGSVSPYHSRTGTEVSF